MTQDKPSKIYLGDAVYAEIVRGNVVLTTENGISITNSIFLEPEVLDSLLTYLKLAKLIPQEKRNG